MLDPHRVSIFFNSDLLKREWQQGDAEGNPAALPDSSLEFLVEVCKELGITHVFEFGSGRSTKAFLSIGCQVTSLEDSDYWMRQTELTLSVEEATRHTRLVKFFKTRFLGLFPVLDWDIDSQIRTELKKAELILVDSPHYTPFRESTLWSSLVTSNGAIVILDDIRIPTLQRFSDRLARSNQTMLHARVRVGHLFDVFYVKPESQSDLLLNHSLMDLLKGWKRYFQGKRFYANLS